MIDCGLHIEHIDAANHFVHATEAHICHVLPHLLRQEEEKVDDVLGLPLKLFAQYRILGRDADGACIEMTFPHHDAAHSNKRRSGKTKLFGSKQGGDDNVAAGLQFSVSLNPDAAAEVIQQQDLLRFC